MLTTYPVREGFVAEIGDLDLSRPQAEATVADIRAALSRYAVLIFPEQDLDEAQQLAFAASLCAASLCASYALCAAASHAAANSHALLSFVVVILIRLSAH